MLYFLFKFLFNIFFKSKKTLFKMATLTFRVGYHKFFYAIWKIKENVFVILGQTYLVIFREFSSFLVQKFSNLSFWNHQLKILRMPTLTLFKYVLVLFLRFCLYHNHNFWNETTVWQKSIEAFFIKYYRKFIKPKLTKLVSRPIHHVKFDQLDSWKKIFHSMC